MRGFPCRTAALVAVVCLLTGPSPAPAKPGIPAGSDEPREHATKSQTDLAIERLPVLIETAFLESALPSLSIAVVHDRDVVLSQALGLADLENDVPVTSETVYPIGSITKLFVATMLVQLHEKQVVSLDDPVRKYLPEYRVQSTAAGTQPTTLRQLATHTSGLPREANVNFWSDYATLKWITSGGSTAMRWYAPAEEVLANLRHVNLAYPPNSRYEYSNLGMALLGIALERAADEPFPAYMKEHVLEPLGMKATGFLLHEQRPSRVPKGYVSVEGKAKPLVAPEWEFGIGLYTGGLYSTAEDMTRFISLQFQDEAPGGSQIVSADGLRMMHLESIGWGVGWGRYPVIEHTGGHIGFFANVIAIPKLKIGVVALTNSHNPLRPERPARDIARAILDAFQEAVLADAMTGDAEAESIGLERYVGLYTLPGVGAEIEIGLDDGRLVAKLLQDPSFSPDLTPVERGKFAVEGDTDPSFVFATDDKGRVSGVRFAGYSFERKR